MKKLLSMAVLIGMTTIAIMSTAFTTPTKTESVLEVTVSPVWEGKAYPNGASGRYENVFTSGNSSICTIRVYPSDNSCGAYYAVKLSSSGRESDVHYTVKNNPDYDYRSNNRENVAYYSHYINVDGRYLFFTM